MDYLLKIESDNAFGNGWIHRYTKETKPKILPKQDLTFKINQNIISYTLYNVLKKQKYYNQAGLVLDMLESSNQINSKIYQKEHKVISKLLNP